MKVIKLYKGAAAPNGFNAKDVFAEVMKQTPRGCNIDGMRLRMRVLDALEKANDTLSLEDADFNLLRDTFLAFDGFRLVHPDIIAIAESLTNPNDPAA